MINYEKKIKRNGFDFIVGVDEAGRGPLAGPVVASAVVLKEYDFGSRINDSKKLTSRNRELAFHEIYQKAYVGVGIISELVIDERNILEATFLAMNKAIEQLICHLPEEVKGKDDFDEKVCLLIDGNQFKSHLPYMSKTIIKGDSSVFSISCASIIAKVTRDRILNIYHRIFPQYGFSQHKGYPTLRHKQAIDQFGPSIFHRMTFNSVK